MFLASPFLCVKLWKTCCTGRGLASLTLLAGCNAGVAHVDPQGSVGFFIR
jgi:hypothetical protein